MIHKQNSRENNKNTSLEVTKLFLYVFELKNSLDIC